MYSIELDDDEVSAALDKLGRQLADMTPVMQDIGELLVASNQDRVQKGLQPDGQPFAPRSQTTLDRYAAKELSFGAVLNQSGDMRLGVHYQAGADQLEIGSNAIQAAVMQFGAEQGAFGAHMGRTKPSEKRKKSQSYFVTLPWGDIPARPWLGVSEDDRSNILAELQDWLGGAVKTAP